ncbi:MAG TPA: hypothetical protein VFA68_01045 [Terriglobales bacterium]|nr:hypothetical protein [Terriglobales bacterium]
MTKPFWATFILATALAFTTPALMADHGNHKQHGNKHHAEDDDHGWERRDGYEYRAYGDHDDRPPGWSRGKKTGWGDCGLPPGQAKKYGCRKYIYEGRPHYYYKDDAGRIVIRRPIIDIHGGVEVR